MKIESVQNRSNNLSRNDMIENKGADYVAEIKYEIIHHVGILSESPKGWTKEVNLISWNGRDPKYDLRDWAPNKEKMGKGITLTEEELQKLGIILKEMT